MTGTTEGDSGQTCVSDGLPASVVQWWVALCEPTSMLKTNQKRELAEIRVGGWQQDASCAQADPEAWFPGGACAGRQVLTVCGGCPVRRSCLASALMHREYGVWAGTTEEQRRGMCRLLRAGEPVAEVLDAALDNDPATSAEVDEAA